MVPGCGELWGTHTDPVKKPEHSDTAIFTRYLGPVAWLLNKIYK